MRCSVLLAGTIALFAVSAPVHADSAGDIDQCRFAGEIRKADQSIAACDRVLNNPEVTGQGRAAAFSSRCGWWWAKKDPDRALPDCNEAIRVDPGYAAAYINRGNAYLSKAETDRAFDDFNQAIRLDPRNAWAYSARGDIYKGKGDLDRAMADFRESIRLNPGYAMAYFFRGDVYRGQGDFEHAMADLNESIRLDPNYAMAYFTRGCVSYLRGENTSALADFTRAIQLNPRDAAAFFNRGVAYFLIGGRIADAEADFRKASELNPTDAYAALWRDLAERRNGVPSHLAEASSRLDMTAWPAPLVRHFLGELNAAQTLAAADASDPKTRLGQSCEANFYGGEFAMLKKNRPEALRLLRLAAKDCPRGYIESPAAIAELITQR